MPDQMQHINLASRPTGAPTPDNFSLETGPIPEPGDGEVLVRVHYMSLDPYMRGRMNDAKSYADPVKIDEVMTGQVVGEVMASNLEGFAPGDHVLNMSGWQDYALSDVAGVITLGQNPDNPSWFLGVLGMPGSTAYGGLIEIGQPKPGETVVVAAA